MVDYTLLAPRALADLTEFVCLFVELGMKERLSSTVRKIICEMGHTAKWAGRHVNRMAFKLLREKPHLERVSKTSTLGMESNISSRRNLSKYLLYPNCTKSTESQERSKHLETGTAHICGSNVKSVNLRGETYTGDSRNPQMGFATAGEDALRRDDTVNALFYIVEKQEWEDFIGNGLQDKAAGVLRTPLDPHQTFKNDPLRVLRLIRLASKLGYGIDDKTKQSMEDEMKRESLNTKISRERVGIEVFKMVKGRNPAMAFQLIVRNGALLNDFSQLRQPITSVIGQPASQWPTQTPMGLYMARCLPSSGKLVTR